MSDRDETPWTKVDYGTPFDRLVLSNAPHGTSNHGPGRRHRDGPSFHPNGRRTSRGLSQQPDLVRTGIEEYEMHMLTSDSVSLQTLESPLVETNADNLSQGDAQDRYSFCPLIYRADGYAAMKYGLSLLPVSVSSPIVFSISF